MTARLSWPGTVDAGPVEGVEAQDDAAPKPVRAGRAPAKATRAKGTSKGASTSAPKPAAEPPVALGEVPLGRVFVDAFDRLADRLLERLRSLRSDLETDVASLRAEVAGLRDAVDELGDRVQVRQMRGTLDELHAEVVALRRAVLEWPELEQLSHDVAAVRGDLSFLFDTTGEGGPGQAPSELLGELQAVIARLAATAEERSPSEPVATTDAALAEELAGLRSELIEVRRRVGRPGPPLDEGQLEWLVGAVADRVVARLGGAEPEEGRRGRRRVGRESAPRLAD